MIYMMEEDQKKNVVRIAAANFINDEISKANKK